MKIGLRPQEGPRSPAQPPGHCLFSFMELFFPSQTGLALPVPHSEPRASFTWALSISGALMDSVPSPPPPAPVMIRPSAAALAEV
jgi:hypothetical protein